MVFSCYQIHVKLLNLAPANNDSRYCLPGSLQPANSQNSLCLPQIPHPIARPSRNRPTYTILQGNKGTFNNIQLPSNTHWLPPGSQTYQRKKEALMMAPPAKVTSPAKASPYFLLNWSESPAEEVQLYPHRTPWQQYQQSHKPLKELIQDLGRRGGGSQPSPPHPNNSCETCQVLILGANFRCQHRSG